jgi:hypothetical protein
VVPETRQRIHVNIFNLTEAQHREVSRLRENIYDLVGYLQQEDLTFSANHMFQNYRMRNSPRRYFEEMLTMFDMFEVKNGAMTSHHNRLVEDLMALVRAKNGRVSLVAGSDAHTLTPLARFSPSPSATRSSPISTRSAPGSATSGARRSASRT